MKRSWKGEGVRAGEGRGGFVQQSASSRCSGHHDLLQGWLSVRRDGQHGMGNEIPGFTAFRTEFIEIVTRRMVE